MRRRMFVPKDIIKRAYRNDIEIREEVIEEETVVEKVDKLPEELFKVVGKVVSFIEVSDKMEEK